MNGPENPYVLAEELGDWMTDNVTVVRENDKLRETEAKLEELDGALEAHRPDRPLGVRATARSRSSTSSGTCSCSRAS